MTQVTQVTQVKVSLVVLGFRNFDATTRVCLNSLMPWGHHPDVEILVLDNGSLDGSAEKTAQWCASRPQVRCLLGDINRGFSGGMNWAAEHASGDWLLLVNNDTVFPDRAIDALLGVLQNAPDEVAMIGPVTNAAGNGQRLWKPGATPDEWLQIGKCLHQNPAHELMPTYRCDFFCIAIRRCVWTELGGLDPEFGLGYYEDFDFSLRLVKAGYRQMISEDVFVFHAGSATFKASAEARALMKRNKKLLLSKHPEARLEHTRLGNLEILKTYQALEKAGRWTESLAARRALRIGALTDDVPRSLLKKMLWRRKTAKLRLS